MERSMQLPELAEVGTPMVEDLRQAGVWAEWVRITILNRPAADLSAVQLEGEQSADFRGGKAVGGRRGASQAFIEEVGDRLGPRVVWSRQRSRDPELLFLARAGAEVTGGECVGAAGGEASSGQLRRSSESAAGRKPAHDG